MSNNKSLLPICLIAAALSLIAVLSWTYAAPVAASTPTTQTATAQVTALADKSPQRPSTGIPKKESPDVNGFPVCGMSPTHPLMVPPKTQSLAVDLKSPTADPHSEALDYIKRGSDFLKKGELGSAISELEKALEIDKDSIDASVNVRRNLALALLSEQLPLSALDQLNIVVEASKPSSYDHQLIGQAYLAEGQNLDAAAAYKEALQIDQLNEYARGGLATAYAYQGDFPGSLKIIQDGLQRSKSNVVWTQYFKRLMDDITKLAREAEVRALAIEREHEQSLGLWDSVIDKSPDIAVAVNKLMPNAAAIDRKNALDKFLLDSFSLCFDGWGPAPTDLQYYAGKRSDGQLLTGMINVPLGAMKESYHGYKRALTLAARLRELQNAGTEVAAPEVRLVKQDLSEMPKDAKTYRQELVNMAGESAVAKLDCQLQAELAHALP